MIAAMSLTSVTISAIMYVDDTDLFVTDEQNQDPQLLQDKAQEMIKMVLCTMDYGRVPASRKILVVPH